MSIIIKDQPLKELNTFGIAVQAGSFQRLQRLEDLAEFGYAMPTENPPSILGGGSNILFTKNVEGVLLKNELKGIAIVKEDEEHTFVQAQAGESWHQLVLFAIDKGLGGIENLALIPGTVGAAPIQNIGAYGVEVKDTITEVAYWHWPTGSIKTLDNDGCQFGYRDSIFKNELKGKVLVTAVTFKLKKQPKLSLNYGAINEQLALQNIKNPTVKDVAEAVIAIRQSKLPDPAKLGNAGSFFKNPTLPEDVVLNLKKSHPDLPTYLAGEGYLKIPAGWLIEQCGWKGRTIGNAGVHKQQALVIVNYGGSTGKEIWQLSEAILLSVKVRFGITLEREVQVW